MMYKWENDGPYDDVDYERPKTELEMCYSEWADGLEELVQDLFISINEKDDEWMRRHMEEIEMLMKNRP